MCMVHDQRDDSAVSTPIAFQTGPKFIACFELLVDVTGRR